jgi:hypothetical protein
MFLQSFNKLNRHTRIAIFVAPILMILGFGASDFWMSNKAMEARFFEMKPVSDTCDILRNECVLVSGEFKISVYQKDGITTLNSTFPLDTATLFLVDKNDNATAYRMGMKDSPYYWYKTTPINTLAQMPGDKQKIRFVATVKGGQYVAEFMSTNMAN